MGKTGRKYLILAILACFMAAIPIAPLHAREIDFRLSVSRTKVTVGKIFSLNLIFEGTRDVPAPEVPPIGGFQVEYMGPSTRVSIINGRKTSSITHMFTLIPLRAGQFTIGPFSFGYGGNTYLSNSVTVTVVGGPSGAGPSPHPQVTYDETERLRDRVFLVMSPEKQKAYVNEIIRVYLKLYINRINIRDIQYPEFSQKGFSVSGFERPQQHREIMNRVRYEIVEFKTFIYGTQAGKFFLNPAGIRCNILVEKKRRRLSRFGGLFDDDLFDDIFGGYDILPFEAKSKKVPITIMPIPREGRPGDFTGAVGQFDFTAGASPRKVKVGDPITLTMKIKGDGNFSTVMCPVIETGDKFKVYQPRVSQEPGAKIFEQILLPTEEAVKEIPPVSFSFFDPKLERYRTITSDATAITVVKSKKGKEALLAGFPRFAPRKAPDEELLGRDIVYIKESPGRLRKKGLYVFEKAYFVIPNILGALFFVSLLVAYRRKEKLEKDIRYARRLVAPKKARANLKKARYFLAKADAGEFYGALFKTLQSYFGDKFHLPTHGITITVIDEVLRPKGVKEEALEKLKSVFEECDLVRYATSAFDREKMEESFKKTSEIIDYFERARL
ncbi:MAG: BatD family protein [Candidatus Omnitrophota bacterium]